MSDLPAVHLIIPTHTTRHLDLCLLGAAAQTVAPTTITVTCDVIDTRIDRLLTTCATRLGLTIRHVRRVHHGVARISQVRNNAVRALLKAGHDAGRLLIVDGDTVIGPRTVELHARLGGEHGLVVASRLMLDESRTAAATRQAQKFFANGAPAPAPPLSYSLEPTEEDLTTLGREHARALRHLRLRRFGLTKRHKPKILGGHFSIRFDLYQRLNGCDEEYAGYGMEDDDLGRRAYAAGADAVVAIRDIPVMHLFHPTRAGGRWKDNPGYQRFRRRDLPVRCVHGLESPVPQHAVLDDLITPHPAATAW